MNSKPSVGNRLVSMLLDHIVTVMAGMLVAMPIMFSGMGDLLKVSHEQTDMSGTASTTAYAVMFIFALYFFKDSIGGRSAAKRGTKLQVVDNTTGEVASPIKCVIRNIFCLIWPLEILVTFFSPSRRIGDFVASTKVVNYEPTEEKPKLNWAKIAIAALLSIGIAAAFNVGVMAMMPTIGSSKQAFVESSYNETVSTTLQQLYTDSLGGALTADVKFYDSIEASNLKYVSVIFNLEQNYIDDSKSFKSLNKVTKRLLWSIVPEDSVAGQFKYVYTHSGGMQMRTISITPKKE